MIPPKNDNSAQKRIPSKKNSCSRNIKIPLIWTKKDIYSSNNKKKNSICTKIKTMWIKEKESRKKVQNIQTY